MAGFSVPSVPAVPYVPRPAVAPNYRRMPQPTRAVGIQTPPAPASKKRPRNIACVTCNKQKKKCGLVRPCPRCIELKIPCHQPVKPEGYSYLTKKQKLSDEPLAFPANLWMTREKPPEDEKRPQQPPSPSPTVSTVGTPQTCYTSASSYDDSASIGAPVGKSVGVIDLDLFDSDTSPRSAASDCPLVLALPEEPVLKISSTWDLLAPLEELSDEMVKNSKFSGAPVFGLEEPIYQADLQLDITTFGEPMDLGVDCTVGVDDSEGQRIDEVPAVDVGVATSGVASGAAGGIAWDPNWLDEVDLSNQDLDDVDLSDFDFQGINDDILMDFQLSEILEQPPPAPSPPSLPPRAEAGVDRGPQSPGHTSVGLAGEKYGAHNKR